LTRVPLNIRGLPPFRATRMSVRDDARTLPARPRTCLACHATAQLSFRGVPEAYCWPGWTCSACDPEVLMASDIAAAAQRNQSLDRKPEDTAVPRRHASICVHGLALGPHPVRWATPKMRSRLHCHDHETHTMRGPTRGRSALTAHLSKVQNKLGATCGCDIIHRYSQSKLRD